MHKLFLVSTLISALFFAISCDSGLKFNNPLENSHGGNDAEIQDMDSDESADTDEPTDAEPDDTDTDDSGDSEPTDSGDSEPTDSGDSEPTDSGDSEPTDSGDSEPTDSGDSQPDEDNVEPDEEPVAADEDTTPTADEEPAADEEPLTRTKTCSGLPANASWHNGSSITQTFDGNDWYPPATGFYSETAVTNECGFKCNQGYNWNSDWGKCFIKPAFGNICTGQINCYDNGNEITCPTSESADFYGQDAQYAKLGYCYPQSFTLKTNNSGENIVVDNNTGLEWQQVISEETFNWEKAITHCKDLYYGGYADWRLPNPQELLTIVNDKYQDPSVDETYFSNTISGIFWSSVPYIANTNNAWYAYIGDGDINPDGSSAAAKTTPHYARCVRGSELSTTGSFTNSTVNGDQIVTDNNTSLMWQNAHETDKTWKEALKYCEDLSYAGYNDWRLPNKNELASLTNQNKYNTASDFPDITNDWLWSSSTRTASSSYAWDVNFENGDVFCHSQSNSYNKANGLLSVRCVRSERINDPCENHTCGSVAHSSGVCVPENAFEYSCTCDNGYFWNGTQCKIMPECSASSGTPCKDLTNHLIWSPLASKDMTQPNALNYCENLVLYGFSDWHLPTIDELRTLIKNCPGTETNGACAISEKNGKLSESDSSSSCSCTHMNNNGGYYSKIGDDDTVSPWSSSSRSDDTERAWYVGFFAGKINNSEKSVLSDVRCVRKEQ